MASFKQLKTLESRNQLPIAEDEKRRQRSETTRGEKELIGLGSGGNLRGWGAKRQLNKSSSIES